MFDRKAYGGRCVTCGVKLTFKCTTFQCEHCREKQKYQNVAKVNISKLIAEAKADTVRKMQHKIWLEFSDCYVEDEITVGSFRASVDQIAKEMLEGENG